MPLAAAHLPAAPVITLPTAAAAAAAAGPSATASPAPSGSTSSVVAEGSLVSGDNLPRIASLPNLHLRLHRWALGMWGACCTNSAAGMLCCGALCAGTVGQDADDKLYTRSCNRSGADSRPKPKRSRLKPAEAVDGGSRGAKEKMLPRARSHNDLAGEPWGGPAACRAVLGRV